VKSGVVNSGSEFCNRWKEGQKAIENRQTQIKEKAIKNRLAQ
jgi:hypothetical protein